MKASEIYRLAAHRMESKNEEFCCHAICNVTDELSLTEGDLCERMRALFSSDEGRKLAWMSEREDHARDLGVTGHPTHERRILALCFMAAISESEGN